MTRELPRVAWGKGCDCSKCHIEASWIRYSRHFERGVGAFPKQDRWWADWVGFLLVQGEGDNCFLHQAVRDRFCWQPGGRDTLEPSVKRALVDAPFVGPGGRKKRISSRVDEKSGCIDVTNLDDYFTQRGAKGADADKALADPFGPLKLPPNAPIAAFDPWFRDSPNTNLGPVSGVVDLARRKFDAIVYVEQCPWIYMQWGFDVSFDKSGNVVPGTGDTYIKTGSPGSNKIHRSDKVG
jgi:hypothetical protein